MPWDAASAKGTGRRSYVHVSPAFGSRQAAWDTPAKAFAAALDDFTDDELAVVERYLRRSTRVGDEQAERLRNGEEWPGQGGDHQVAVTRAGFTGAGVTRAGVTRLRS